MVWLTGGVAAIDVWLFLSGQQKAGRIALEWVLILAFTCYAIFPFDQRRNCATWAKYVMTLSGLLGVAAHLVRLMLHYDWLALGKATTSNLYLLLRYTNLLLLFVILGLIISGQLLGAKRKVND